MTLSIVGTASAWAFSQAAVTPLLSSAPLANDYGVISLMSKYDTATLGGPPAGWTDLGTAINAGRAAGNDNGNLRTRSFGKILTAGEAMPSLSPANNNVSGAHAMLFRSTTGFYDVQALVLPDDTPGTPLAISGSLSIQAGDKLYVTMHGNADIATPTGVASITATGATLTEAVISGHYTTALGTDARAASWTYNVTAGSASSISWSHAMTGTTTNFVGTVHIVRVREATGSPEAPEFSGWGIPI